MTNGAIERELAEKGGASRCPLALLRERDGDRDREVEPAALLAHLRRREVHSQPLARKIQAAVLDRRPDPLTRFLDRGCGQADEKELGLSVGAVGLDLYAPGLEAREHAPPSACARAPT